MICLLANSLSLVQMFKYISALQGPFQGQRGKMLDKSGEAASVQLNEDFSIHNFSLDAIAEYTGDADENE